VSEKNAVLVRRCYDFWRRRDYSMLPEVFDPDVVLDLSRNVFNPDVYRGHDGLVRYVEVVDETWEGFDARLTELIEVGDRVVTGTRISGRGRGSGVAVEMQLFNVWTFRDGRVLHIVGGYRERGEALDTARQSAKGGVP
jgi:ketosteroid isomerase-like protein